MNEQELYDTLATLRLEYLATGTQTPEIDNYLFACSVAHDACLSNTKAKLEQALFFIDKVIH